MKQFRDIQNRLAKTSLRRAKFLLLQDATIKKHFSDLVVSRVYFDEVYWVCGVFEGISSTTDAKRIEDAESFCGHRVYFSGSQINAD